VAGAAAEEGSAEEAEMQEAAQMGLARGL